MLAMALQAPSHSERRELADLFHAFYRSMAPLAGNAREDMLAVVEIDKVRQVMDLDPANRYLPLYGLLQLFNLHCLLFYDVVAVHAHACRWNSRMAAGACGIVTIETRNLVIAGMHLVRKANRLLG